MASCHPHCGSGALSSMAVESLLKNCRLRPVKGAKSARKLLVAEGYASAQLSGVYKCQSPSEANSPAWETHQLTLLVYQALKNCVRQMDPSAAYHLVASLADRQS